MGSGTGEDCTLIAKFQADDSVEIQGWLRSAASRPAIMLALR